MNRILQYGFIFVRTKKTASTAVEARAEHDLWPDDVIAPIGAGQEILRSQLGAAPRNFNFDRTLEQRLAEAVRHWPAGACPRVDRAEPGRLRCTGHMSASAVKTGWRRRSGSRPTNSRRAASLREGLSLATSNYKGRDRKRVTFRGSPEETVKNGFRLYAGYKIYAIDGKCVMSGSCCHDTLTADLAALRDRLRLPAFELPRAKKPPHRPTTANEVLSDSQKGSSLTNADANSNCSAGKQ